jgi:hypothetical protein
MKCVCSLVVVFALARCVQAQALARATGVQSAEAEERAAEAARLADEGLQLARVRKLSEALEKLKTALAVREQLYPPGRFPDGHIDLATSLNNLAFVLTTLGRPSEALVYDERALAMREKLYPPRSFPTATPSLPLASIMSVTFSTRSGRRGPRCRISNAP